MFKEIGKDIASKKQEDAVKKNEQWEQDNVLILEMQKKSIRES